MKIQVPRTSAARVPIVGVFVALLASLLASAFLLSNTSADVTTGLAAHWKFDEGTGQTAGDSSGNSNTGTISGATWTTGKIGGALDFDGIDDYASIANSPSLDITGTEITLSAWVYTQNCCASGGSRVISKRNDSGGSDVYSLYFNGSTEARFRLDGSDLVVSNAVTPNQWIHFTAVYNGIDKRLYKNGALIGSPQAKTDTIDSSARGVFIGHREGQARWFDGLIDDVRVYNRALSAAEVAQLFQDGSGTPPAPPPPPTPPPTPGAGDKTTVTDLELVPTYESIGVYASFSGDDNANNTTTLEWRKTGTSRWITGMDMVPDRREVVGRKLIANPYKNQWRVSVLMVQPNTQYEIRVTFSDPDGLTGSPITRTVTTRTDQISSVGRSLFVSPIGTATACADGATFKSIQTAVNCTRPGDTVYVKAGTYPGGVIVSNSGVANNYITIRNYQSDKVVINANSQSISCAGAWTEACAFHVTGSYIRLKGFDIVGGWNLDSTIGYGIIVGPEKSLAADPTAQHPHDVIVEDNILRDTKTLVSPFGPFVAIRVGGASAGFYTQVEKITVQGNTIHMVEPGGGTRGANSTGAAIQMTWPNGGNVIRNNNIFWTGTVNVHGKDCIVTVPNFSDTAEDLLRSTKDTDIYNNYCEGATDDGISLDGSGLNVRVWNNTMLRSMNGVSITPVDVGPAYIFRNVYTEPETHWTPACGWVKGGESGTGYVYFYHNTVVLDNVIAEGYGLDCETTNGYRLSQGSGDPSQNVFSKNNIIDVDGLVTTTSSDKEPTMDHDLLFNSMATGVKPRWADWGGDRIGGFSQTNAQNFAEFQSKTCGLGACQEANGIPGRATFVNRITEDFRLAAGSLGIDKGAVIQGFNDPDSPWPYTGTAPDIGAFESGGVASPPPTPTPAFSSTLTRDHLFLDNPEKVLFEGTNFPTAEDFRFRLKDAGSIEFELRIKPIDATTIEIDFRTQDLSLLQPGFYTIELERESDTTKLTHQKQFLLTKLGDLPDAQGNRDGKINLADVSLLLTKWGDSDSAADINSGPSGISSGKVDLYDANKLMRNWTG